MTQRSIVWVGLVGFFAVGIGGCSGGDASSAFSGSEYFFPSNQGRCYSMKFDSAGRVSDEASGPCSGSSRVECEDQNCFLTCQQYSGSDSSVVFYLANETENNRILLYPVEDSLDAIGALISGVEDGAAGVLYKSLAACETAS